MKQLLILILIILAPIKSMAQWSFDVVSVEAYINDHKKQRSLLLARSTLEYSNKLLHEYSSKETTNYKDINVDLDKYTRAFDVIDVLYQSLRTGMNTYSTYENVKERISDYKKLLNDFNEQVVKRKHIEAIDTMIVTINLRAIANIAKEGDCYGSISQDIGGRGAFHGLMKAYL